LARMRIAPVGRSAYRFSHLAPGVGEMGREWKTPERYRSLSTMEDPENSPK